MHSRDVVIDGTWDALGLRGTGSHDVAVTAARIPATHLACPVFAPARHPGPLWTIPFVTQLAVSRAGFPLGVARRALEEFVRVAAETRRGRAITSVAESDDAQVRFAQVDGGLRAARAYVVDTLDELWQTAQAGDPPGTAQRTALLLATLGAHRAAEAAVDTVFSLAGARSVYAEHPLQRCFRDVHTAGQHVFVSADAWKACALHELGLSVPDHRI